MNKTFFLVTAVLIGSVSLLVGGIIYAQKRHPKEPPHQSFLSRITATSQPTATPTLVPFPEMTIPYLRNRDYTSKLGDREAAYTGPNYTAYVTSYDSDGLKINGLLTQPNGPVPTGGWPAIVFIHGYIPPTQYQTLERYGDYIDYFARNGFVVFKIDLRGHGTSEGEPGGAYYSSDYVIDTLNAYAALQTASFVNKNAIGLWGHSMAGNIVMRSLAARPDIPAAVIWAGAVYTYTDFTTYRIQDSSYVPLPSSSPTTGRRQRLIAAVGEITEENPYWKLVAPTSYLNDLTGAIQIHHAVDDDVVNIEYSRNLKALLDKTSVQHQLFEYESGGHNLSGYAFVEAMERGVNFFKKYLGDEMPQ